MAIWKEKYIKGHHGNAMYGSEAPGFETRSEYDNIRDNWVYFIEACGFTFQFLNVAQLSECLAYYEIKNAGSTREEIGAADHWEVQRWYERLPLYLREETKRIKVVKVLKKAQEIIVSNKVIERGI
ncbi:MAG: hypothetical protein P8179_24910 [Candidatus Thiodiazotropha sp.]|jgi:hypothetical protein